MEAFPLLTEPLFKDYIWGGRKLATALGKSLPEQGEWAESWEIVDHPQHQSRIRNTQAAGSSLRQLAQQHPRWLFGERQLDSVPLLLKYLDCQRVLSVQVHPEDAYAQKMTPPDLGKTEAWYIVAAEPGAVLYAGLKAGVTRSDLRQALADGTVETCLHAIYPSAGDCVFIPAGTVHALGAGLLVAEIQQASNTTFRLFDWNRLGNDGKPRELHIEQSLEVIDFEAGPRSPVVPQPTTQPQRKNLVRCDKFVLDAITGPAEIELENSGEMHFVTVPHGAASLHWESGTTDAQQPLCTGESAILPAAMPGVTCHVPPGSVLLDMYLPS